MNRSGHNSQTLSDLLKHRASKRPDDVAVVVEEKEYSWSWIYKRSCSFAAQLVSSGVGPGAPVVIRVPNSIEFLIAFYGTQLAGAIPVPIFPEARWVRCARILKLCQGRDLVFHARQGNTIIKETGFQDSPLHIRWHGVDGSLTQPDPGYPRIPEPTDTALIQYTSGSTGFPKGVVLTHQQLLTNIRQMTRVFKITDKDIFASWLPAHHDMGLILCVLVPLFTGAKLILLTNGLRKIHTWMEAIDKHRATFTAAPDLAYRLCVKGIKEPQRYNLSSLRIALNAAEPIRKTTIDQFENHFGLQNIMVTGYGLAEASVAVSIHPPGKQLVTDLSGHVSSGRALKGIQIRIVSGNKVLPAGIPGEIQVMSPACMNGYFRSHNKPFTREGYLKTGDLGYLDNRGNLFVLGRKKNVIKQGGQTIYADDLEEVAESVDGVRRAAALGIKYWKTGDEQLTVLAEYRRQTINPDEGNHLITEMVTRIYSHFGMRPARVYLLRPKSIPLTPNGKPRYSRLNDVILSKYEEFKQLIIYQ